MSCYNFTKTLIPLELKNGISRLILVDFGQNRGTPPLFERFIHLYLQYTYHEFESSYMLDLIMFFKAGITEYNISCDIISSPVIPESNISWEFPSRTQHSTLQER